MEEILLEMKLWNMDKMIVGKEGEIETNNLSKGLNGRKGKTYFREWHIWLMFDPV